MSPLIFVLYVSDLEDWLEFSKAFTYADDTSSSLSGKDLQEIIRKMEIDAVNVLKFMASNGLVANPTKTTLLFLNHGKLEEQELSIKIGKVNITKVSNAKLLGITFDDDLKWNSQVYGKGGVLSCLNQRLFVLRRLKNFVNREALIKVANSIFVSKIRYGLQLIGKVRLSNDDTTQGDIEAIQMVQNKMVRLINGCRLLDKISTKRLLNNVNMLSVNQINAQIKISEVWKAEHVPNHPLKIEKVNHESSACKTRSVTNGDLKEFGKSNIVQSTFISDASRVWNICPDEIKNSDTFWKAKKAIKSFVKTLPI